MSRPFDPEMIRYAWKEGRSDRCWFRALKKPPEDRWSIAHIRAEFLDFREPNGFSIPVDVNAAFVWLRDAYHEGLNTATDWDTSLAKSKLDSLLTGGNS